MKVTILDIAKEAGVSKSTVSLVINNQPNVKLETKYKVEQAIEKLGYVPNLAARELTTRKTNTLGLIFLTSNSHHKPYAFNSVAETLLYDTSNGIYSALKNTEFTLLTERFSMDDTVSQLPYLIKSRRVDGVFLIGGLFSGELIDSIKERNIPAVIIGRNYSGMDSVAADTEMVGYMGMIHLIEKGHKNIVFLNGPISSENSKYKLDGVLKAVEKTGFERRNLHVQYSKYTGLDAYQAMEELWNKGVRPDGILGGSDGITAGALRFLYEKRVKVPEDVSVIGYEDSILSEYSAPALTVIDAHKEKMGQEACNVLINRIRKPKSKEVTLRIAPSLIIRDSVKDHTKSD